MLADPSPAADRPTRWGLTVKLFGALLLSRRPRCAGDQRAGLRPRTRCARGKHLPAIHRSAADQGAAGRGTFPYRPPGPAAARPFQDGRRGDARLPHGRGAARPGTVADGLRPKVEAWYEAHYMPDVRRLLGKDVPLADYMPVTPSGNYLQYHYIVANPHPPGRRDLLDDAATAATTAGCMRSIIRCCARRPSRSASTTS